MFLPPLQSSAGMRPYILSQGIPFLHIPISAHIHLLSASPSIHLPYLITVFHNGVSIMIQKNADVKRDHSYESGYPQIKVSCPYYRWNSLLLYTYFKFFSLAFPHPHQSASAEPRALHSATAPSSGASLQITGFCTNTAPSASQVSCQVRIHSPSPHP